MILLKRINGEEFFLNPEIIRSVESAGDTKVMLTTGENLLVLNSSAEVAELIIGYKMRVLSGSKEILREQNEERIL